MTTRKFGPYLATLFLGAFTDNLFKNALIFIVTYESLELFGLSTAKSIVVASGIFVLPFFLFSAVAGQIADRYDKDLVMRRMKLFEILLMLLAGAGFLFGQMEFLIFILFLMGSQSALFSPAKYSVIPQLVEDEELLGANALVEAATFLAILTGTMGGMIIRLAENGPLWISALLISMAVMGWVFSLFIPNAESKDKNIQITWNIFKPVKSTLGYAAENRSILWTIFGVSWFWLLGACVLMILPTYAKEFIFVDELVLTSFLLTFTVGVAVGSMLCEKLANKEFSMGLVPVGAIGLFVAMLEIYLIGNINFGSAGSLMGLKDFYSDPLGLSIGINWFVLAIFAGIFIVPLQTYVQDKSPEKTRSRILAANNLMNALCMVIASVVLIIFYAFGLNQSQIIFLLGLGSLAVAFGVLRKLQPNPVQLFVQWLQKLI